LLDYGADHRLVDSKRETPLHFAARSGNAFAVEFLVNNGAYVDAKNDGGYTPLHHVVSSQTASLWSNDAELSQKHKDCELTVKHLLDHGADVNERIRAQHRTLLHLAAVSRCQLSVIARFVDRGAQVTCIDNHRITPLHLAAKMAPIFDSHKPPEKWRISWVACRMIIDILVRYSNINESDWDTLRSQVARLLRKANLRISYRLLSEKVNRTEKTHDAALWFNGVLKLLCSKGASVSARNDRNHNVLQYATLFWASWISKYHASLLYDDVVWGPDEMTKEAAEVEWSRFLQLMSPRTRGQSSSNRLKRRRFGN
jgi:ankyrin repeat protein